LPAPRLLDQAFVLFLRDFYFLRSKRRMVFGPLKKSSCPFSQKSFTRLFAALQVAQPAT